MAPRPFHSVPAATLAGLEVVVVLDGARWPLKSATNTSRRNARDSALEKAKAAEQADDSRQLPSSSSRLWACQRNLFRGSFSTFRITRTCVSWSPTTRQIHSWPSWQWIGQLTRRSTHSRRRQHARQWMSETAQDCSPLFAPGSSEHQAYVLRTLAGGRFALGMAAQVVGADPVWQPAMLGSGARRCVEC